jgi:hypothetical protein
VVATPNGITPAKSLKLNPENLPELTFDMVPKYMGAMAKSLSVSQQVPPSMALLACITTASACVAGKYQIAPVTHNWTEEFSSLNCVIIAESSGGKSRVFSKVTKAIGKWEQKARREMLSDYRLSLIKVDGKRKALKAEDKPSAKALRALSDALEEVPVLPDMIVNDATPEALEERCADHYGRLAVFDDEGGPLKNLTGARWKTPPSFELWKKAWSGGSHRTDRITRETVEIHQACITALLMTQPSLVEQLAQYPAMKGEGLWNRFLFLHLPSNKENLIPSDEAPRLHTRINAKWDEILFRLLDAEHRDTLPHISPNAERIQQVPILHEIALTEKAEAVRKAFEVSMLREIQDGHRLEKVDQWGQKAVGIALRIGAVLELFKRASGGIKDAQIFNTEISEQSMKWGVRIVDVLSDHFLFAMAEKAVFDPPTYVYDKILAEGWGVSRRQVLKVSRRIKKVGELIPILAELENRGLIKEVKLEGDNGQFQPHYFDPDEYTPDLERDALQKEGASKAPKKPPKKKEGADHSRDLWDVWLSELSPKGPHPSLTPKRARVLNALHAEHLSKNGADPLHLFRGVCQSLKRSSHHMSVRAYQLPCSFLSSPERRESWFLRSLERKTTTQSGGVSLQWSVDDE